VSLFVLDTSAVLALFWQEPGWERVSEVLERGDHAIGAVNLAELVTKFVDAGLPQDEIPSLVAALRLNVQPFDAVIALEAGKLRIATRNLGLSLGDRACLALAGQLGAGALTCDGAWQKIDPALDIVIESLRPGRS
jgi:ribonuclease VapC